MVLTCGIAPEGPVRRAGRLRVAGAWHGVWLLLCAAGLAGCTPPWYWFSTVEADGRFLADGHCALDVRGDVTRRTVLRASVGYVDNNLAVTCGGAYPPAARESGDMSSVLFLLPVRAPDGNVARGVYPVVAEHWWAETPAKPGTAFSTATLYPEPANAGLARSYRALGGRLTIHGVSVAPDGAMRVTGTFHVRGRRYVQFD